MSEDGGWADNPEELKKKGDFIVSKISTLEAKAQRSARDPRRRAVPLKRGDRLSGLAAKSGDGSAPVEKSCGAAVETADFPVVEDSATTEGDFD